MKIFHNEGKGMSEGKDLVVFHVPLILLSDSETTKYLRTCHESSCPGQNVSKQEVFIYLQLTFFLEPILDAKMTPERRHAFNMQKQDSPLHITGHHIWCGAGRDVL